ncbi:unnamed protein product [Ectocarpus sp. 4 AP-2014]
MKQRAAGATNRELSKELQGLRSSQKKLQRENAKNCQAAGMVLHRNETLFEAEEGSTGNLEEEVQLERYRVSRLERRAKDLEPIAEQLKKDLAAEKKKVRSSCWFDFFFVGPVQLKVIHLLLLHYCALVVGGPLLHMHIHVRKKIVLVNKNLSAAAASPLSR